MFTTREIIDFAIHIERNGEQFYRDGVAKIGNRELVPLLLFLADEEALHARWFEEMRDGLAAEIAPERLRTPEGLRLQDFIGEQTFSLSETDLTRIEREEELIAVAVEFEEDTILFYEMLSVFIDNPDTLAKVEAFIADERKHMELLRTHGTVGGEAGAEIGATGSGSSGK